MLEAITADHLHVANFEQHIENPDVMDCSEYDTALRKAGDEADKAGDANSAKALRLIAAICSMHFRPDDATEPFAPLVVWANGSRSMASSDLSQEQLDAFKLACSTIQNLPIRTRIADIIWTNDKQAADFGRLAIDGGDTLFWRNGSDRRRFDRGVIGCVQHAVRPGSSTHIAPLAIVAGFSTGADIGGAAWRCAQHPCRTRI